MIYLVIAALVGYLGYLQGGPVTAAWWGLATLAVPYLFIGGMMLLAAIFGTISVIRK